MKAGLRFTTAYLAAGLAFAPAIARAQEVPAPTTNAPTTNAPAADTVGPRELQNFNLSGRVTRQADQPAATRPAPVNRRAEPQPSPPATASTSATQRTVPNDQPRRTEIASTDRARPPAPSAEPQDQTPSSSVTVRLPQLDRADAGAAASSAQAPGPAFAPNPQPASLAPQQGFGLLPWLLAAIALGAGGAFLFWRNRSREAFAGGPQVDAFTAPEPVPPPAPRPAPPPVSAPVPAGSIPGFVSTRLRPWIEIGFHPLRCIVDDNQIVIEFEAELFNSGSAPARAVLAEASLLNAGPAQDQELAAFFANPVGAGERIVEIGPLKRVAMRSQVVTPLAQVQRYEMGGHEVFVPVIAFNALYRWSSGEGQTSISYLLGRDAKDDKLGPFRLDLGPRVFRGLAARLLPTGLRQ